MPINRLDFLAASATTFWRAQRNFASIRDRIICTRGKRPKSHGEQLRSLPPSGADSLGKIRCAYGKILLRSSTTEKRARARAHQPRAVVSQWVWQFVIE